MTTVFDLLLISNLYQTKRKSKFYMPGSDVMPKRCL